MSTDLYRKPTDHNLLLHGDSYRPTPLKKGIPIGQFKHICRICSTDECFYTHSKDLEECFRQCSYPEGWVQPAAAKINLPGSTPVNLMTLKHHPHKGYSWLLSICTMFSLSFLRCSSQAIKGHSWLGAVYRRHELSFVTQSLVLWSRRNLRKSQWSSQTETVKHLYHIHCDCNRFPVEANKHSRKSIVQVWSLQEDVVEGDALVLGTGNKHPTSLVWLLWVVDTKWW